MATPFGRTLRSLQADRAVGPLRTLALASLFGLAWVAWLVVARVPVLEVSSRARLESVATTHHIEVPALGQVVVSHLALGRAVEAGELLVELDAAPESLRATQERLRLATLASQLEAGRAELASANAALDLQQSNEAALAEARASAGEALAAAHGGDDELERLRVLHAGGLLAEAELVEAASRAEQLERRAESAAAAVGRLERELAVEHADRATRREALRREQEGLAGEREGAGAALQLLEYEAERRRIRSPVSGWIADVAALTPGQVVEDGARLASIVPNGGLHVVAWFEPAAALGRIEPGQPARLRLDGFPSAQYGYLSAQVRAVGGEPGNGTVRVELALDDPNASGSPIPHHHGLPGIVEVEVERVSPATLVLRLAGGLVAPDKPSAGGVDE